MWIGTVDAGIALTCDCSASPPCRFVAVDTALALTGQFSGSSFAGVLRDGTGRERRVLAKADPGPRVPVAVPARALSRGHLPTEWVGQLGQRVRRTIGRPTAADSSAYAFPAGFLEGCGSGKWVRAYRSPDGAYRLTLAKLPGGRLTGSLYLGEVGSTVRANGTLRDDRLRLRLTRLDGTPFGKLSAAVAGEGGSLSAKLHDGADVRELRLALETSVPVACRQHAGTLDVVLPGADDDGITGAALTEYADALHRRLAAAGEHGSVWFEPLRLDAEVLSGYVHVRTDARDETHALTFDRAGDRLVPARHFAPGPRRGRDVAAVRRLGLAASAHPLRNDPQFCDWLLTTELTRVAVLREGLAYATVRHPVYGAVRWVVPWAALDDQLLARTSELR